ncbi:antitoxin [Actinomycetospora termitidis]|uniref:Antitoxin n=1 Tax=Actinomycetospora termitidis TaxID=3053470 RepID=A0ABT7M766_9PSEU|nr:antitoxin [Actinomycetospora sp. Odt1-22]MDL5156519.1 antitoxin [Actinomycetospora sp. Odt1-22]
MRTTIDLPEDLHRFAMSIARDTARTLSDVVAELMRRGMAPPESHGVSRSERTGLPLVRLGGVVTVEDVRSLEDEE